MRLSVFHEFVAPDVLKKLPGGVEADVAPTAWPTPADKRTEQEERVLKTSAKLFYAAEEHEKLAAALSALSAAGFIVSDAAPVTSTGYDIADRVVLRHSQQPAPAAEATLGALLEQERERSRQLRAVLSQENAGWAALCQQAGDELSRAQKSMKGKPKPGGKGKEKKPKEEKQAKGDAGGGGKERGAKAKEKAEKAAKKEEAKAEVHADPQPGVDAKKLKAVKKEGGKKAQDLAGMADMGALFQQAMLMEPAGDMALLEIALEAMNVKVDPEAEERKGGADGVAKILITSGDDVLSCIVDVPAMFTDKGAEGNVRGYEVSAADWLDASLANLPGDGAGAEISTKTKTLAKCTYRNDPEKGRFVLKAKDAISGASFAFLRAKSLVVDDDDSDEMVFGDDDMPGY